jgi:hypothetical protein
LNVEVGAQAPVTAEASLLRWARVPVPKLLKMSVDSFSGKKEFSFITQV